MTDQREQEMIHLPGRGTFRTCEDAIAYMEALLNRERDIIREYNRQVLELEQQKAELLGTLEGIAEMAARSGGGGRLVMPFTHIYRTARAAIAKHKGQEE